MVKGSVRASATVWALLGAGVVAGLPACGGGQGRGAGAPAVAASPPSPGPAVPSCGRAHPGVGARRVGDARQGGTLALAETGEGAGRRLLAYVADADEPAIRTVDVAAGKELAVSRLRGNPEQVMVLADGRVVATLRHEGLVEVLEPGASPEATLASRCVVDVPTEPIGLAATPDDGTVLVTSGWAHALSGFDAATMSQTLEVDVPREPRAVVVADDGKRAFVAHVVGGKMSVVDLEGGAKPRSLDLKMRLARSVQGSKASGTDKLRDGCQGFALAKAVEVPEGTAAPAPITEKPPAPPAPAPVAQKPIAPGPKPQNVPSKTPGRIFAPFVTVDPGDSTRITSGYGDSRAGLAAEVSSVTVVDPGAERAMTRSLLALPTRGTPDGRDCILPRSAAHAGSSLYVTCLGIDSLLELDARAVDPARAESRRWRVPGGPTGVAIDTVSQQAVVWSQFDRQVSVIPLAESGPKMMIALSRSPGAGLSPELALGRVLFHRTGDVAISRDGRSCASCHPDGREDALTWSTPEGPRQTVMLAGRLAGSAPFGWTGANPTVEEHVKHTFERLEGSGLPERETAALTAYVASMAAPRMSERAEARRAAVLARGKELFFDAQTQCSSCHVGGGGTDGTPHDVGSRAKVDKSAAFETPSLRFVAGTAPYFHDGRYATLLEMLDATDGSMGHTAHLSQTDRRALAAFLETL